MDEEACLDTCVADVTHFLAVEPLPLALVEPFGEREDVFGLHHVDEGIPNIALVLEVDGKVEEVIQPVELLIDGLQQHLLGVLVGDVLDHQRGPRVLTCRESQVQSRCHQQMADHEKLTL